MNVLIVDDEPAIRRLIAANCVATSLGVLQADTGISALDRIKASFAKGTPVDLVILDLGLPDISGFEVITKIRDWIDIPILVLTVENNEADKVKALDLGANDYVTKPFSIVELMARVRVALRSPMKNRSSLHFRAGPLDIDYVAHQVTVEGQAIKLTATEYQILCVLARNAGALVSHRELLRQIWGGNSVEHTQYVRVYINQIRKKLSLHNKIPQMIFTESGVGYRLFLEEKAP